MADVTRFSVWSGTGREDLCRVSIRMFENHPFAGVATGNFQVIEPRYALQDINLRRPDFIVETPKRSDRSRSAASCEWRFSRAVC